MDEHVKQLLLLGRAHFGRREYDQADYLLREVLASLERYPDVHHMLGVIAHGRGELAVAESHFERAVALNPSYTEAELNLMVTYNDLGKYEAARQIYQRMRTRERGRGAIDPFARGRLANQHADLAGAYADLGLIVEAIRELEKAVELCPGFADLRCRLATYYRDAGDMERARDQLIAAREVNPRYAPARVSLAVIALSTGDTAGAIGELEEALALDPENRAAATYLRLAKAQEAAPASRESRPAEPGTVRLGDD